MSVPKRIVTRRTGSGSLSGNLTAFHPHIRIAATQGHSQQIFALIGDWLKEKGRAVISVVHDLSLAKAYGNSALLLRGGKVIAAGGIPEVFSEEALETAYSMDVYGWMRKMLGQWDTTHG